MRRSLGDGSKSELQRSMAGAKKAHKASGGATSSGGGGAAGKGSKASLAVKWPEGGGITRSWLRQLASALDHASRHLPPEELPSVIPVETADAILMSAHKLLHKERNIVRVDPATPMSAEAAAAAAATTGSTEMKERRSLEASAKTKQQPLNDASSTAPYTHDSAAVAAEGAQDNAEELAHIPGSDSQGQGGAPDREIAQQARSHGKPTEGEVKAENTSSGDKSEREDGSVHASTEKVEGDSGDREGGGQRGEGKGGEEEGPADSSIAEWEQESHAAAASNVEVVVVGDVHGQLHDVLNLFKLIGDPGSQRFCVFNGDYVDRGSWGVETYLYLLAWKVLSLPSRLPAPPASACVCCLLEFHPHVLLFTDASLDTSLYHFWHWPLHAAWSLFRSSDVILQRLSAPSLAPSCPLPLPADWHGTPGVCAGAAGPAARQPREQVLRLPLRVRARAAGQVRGRRAPPLPPLPRLLRVPPCGRSHCRVHLCVPRRSLPKASCSRGWRQGRGWGQEQGGEGERREGQGRGQRGQWQRQEQGPPDSGIPQGPGDGQEELPGPVGLCL